MALRVKIMRTGYAQEEPGRIMQVKLATGSCPEGRSSNCPHQSKIKRLIKRLFWPVGVPSRLCAAYISAGLRAFVIAHTMTL